MNLVKHEVCSHVSGGLPFGLNYMVLLATFLLIAVIIVASCGGVIRLPWYMGGLELCGPRPQQRIIAPELPDQRPQERITAGSQVPVNYCIVM
jgi:di/tricarboxylate transporter